MQVGDPLRRAGHELADAQGPNAAMGRFPPAAFLVNLRGEDLNRRAQAPGRVRLADNSRSVNAGLRGHKLTARSRSSYHKSCDKNRQQHVCFHSIAGACYGDAALAGRFHPILSEKWAK